MAKGKVKFFSNKKNYGFIIGEDNKEYFVHFSSIKMDGYKTLSEKQEVTYDPVKTEKGLQATNVIPGKVPEKPKKFKNPKKEEKVDQKIENKETPPVK